MHYLAGGGCALPTELMCVEWLRANGHPVQVELPPPRPAFQLEVQQPTVSPAKPSVPPPAVHIDGDRTPAAAIPADAIAAFKAVGVEVQLDVGGASVHLVPAYTNQNRIELSIEHAATLRRLLDAFPGARVAQVAYATSGETNRNG